MAKVNAVIHAFNTGEMSASGMARIDQERVRLAAETQENLFPYVVGEGQVRPGTQCIGNSASNNRARLLSFIKSTEETALMELSDETLRIWVDDALVTRPSVTATVGDGTFAATNTDWADTATMSAATLAAGSVANLVDETTETGAVWDATATGTLTLDLTTAKTLRWIALTATENPTLAPVAFTLAGSATGAFAGEQVDVLAVTATAAWVASQCKAFSITTPGSYRYYRLSMTSRSGGSGSYQIAEVSVYDSYWGVETRENATAVIAAPIVTANGNAQIDTAQSKFGGASALFDGSGDSIDTAVGSNVAFGTDSFTVDFWLRLNSTAAVYTGLFEAGVFTNGILIQRITGGIDVWINGTKRLQPAWSPSTGTWYHMALVRNGSTVALYVDGVSLASATDASNIDCTGSGTVRFGSSIHLTGQDLDGWLDEIRISNGVARWTTGFTPPSGAYTTDAFTTLLLHCDGTDTSTTFTDDSGFSTVANRLTMACPTRGTSVIVKQPVTTSSANTEHALTIVVDRGPVIFRCGSIEGDDDYIGETELDVGTHSLAFTPTGTTFWVQFFSQEEREVRVSNCTVASAGVLSFEAPWVADELREIRHDQSGDVVFLAHTNWQQRKIERRGDASWSLVVYRAEDGPFLSLPSTDLTLTPSVLSGNGTMAASRPFFTADHVGALFALFQEGQTVTSVLGAGQEFSDAIAVTGIGTGRNFTYAITGSWQGTISQQRSFDGSNFGFVDFATNTSNASGTVSDTPTLDNIDAWYRFGFASGAYSRGRASIALTFGGGGGWGVARVVGFNSSTSVAIEVLAPFKQIKGTKTWTEGSWSDAQGWPSSVALFDGRLWWGGEDRFWASESDDYTAFNLDTEGDAGSIQRAVATGGAVNFINWMLPLQRLVFGTDGAEATARASTFDEPLTPTNIGIKDASTQGVAAISPAKMDGRCVFVQRSGIKVYEILYSLEKQDYVSAELTKLNGSIGGDGILELAVQRQPQSYIWMVRADGQCPILIYDPNEQVAGFIRFIAAPSIAGVAEVESVAVLPGDTQDNVYLSVKRTINGSTVRFIEKLAKNSEAIGSTTNKMADAATLTAGPVSSVTLAHLASETGLVAWGTNTSTGVSGPITGLSANASGVISLGATYTNVWVGLKYTWRYKTSKLAYGAQMTALLQRKRIAQLGLLAENIHHNAVTFGADFTTMRKLPRTQLGETVSETAVEATYDFSAFPFPGGWSTDSRVCLKGEAPYPATLLGLLVGVETNEK
jgi:hypothetical protein